MGEQVFRPIATSAMGGTGIVATPFQFVFTGAEALRISTANSLAGVVVALQGRILQPDGTVTPFVFTQAPNTDRTVKSSDFKPGPGALLTVTAFAVVGAPVRGQTFVQVQVIQGLGGATTVLGTLLQDYVTSFQNLAWPGSPIANSLDGRGFLHALTLANPAAGGGFFTTVPPGVRWRLQSIACDLSTAGVATTRLVWLDIFKGGNSVAKFLPGGAIQHPGDNFISWCGTAGFSSAAQGAPVTNIISSPLSDGIYLSAGDQFFVSAFIDPSDFFSQIAFLVEEWLELN